MVAHSRKRNLQLRGESRQIDIAGKSAPSQGTRMPRSARWPDRTRERPQATTKGVHRLLRSRSRFRRVRPDERAALLDARQCQQGVPAEGALDVADVSLQARVSSWERGEMSQHVNDSRAKALHGERNSLHIADIRPAHATAVSSRGMSHMMPTKAARRLHERLPGSGGPTAPLLVSEAPPVRRHAHGG